MSTAALEMVRTRTVEREAVATSRFAPTEPLIWLLSEQHLATEDGVPEFTRWLARIKNAYLRVRYERLRQPRISEARHMVLPGFRGGLFTRREARLLVRKPTDSIYALPVGTTLDTDVQGNPTQCFPLREIEKDEAHAKLYANADLREFICAELWEENQQLKEELSRLDRLSPLAERIITKCERL